VTIAAPQVNEAPSKRRQAPDALYVLKQETDAARMLIEHLKVADLFDDEELVNDTVEGETRLFEVIDEVLKKMGEHKTHAEALKAHGQEIKDRRSRMEAAWKKGRAAIGIALRSIGKKSHKSAFGTPSWREGDREVEITEEADIPAKYWIIPKPIQPPPELDMDALRADLEALKDGETIAGARLGEVKLIVSIRGK
jgi:hypothetical protein